MIADLDTLLIALYVKLTDPHHPLAAPHHRTSPGRPPAVSDAEVVCLAVAQVLLGLPRRAPLAAGRAHPGRAPVSSAAVAAAYNRRLRGVADLMAAALRWLADHTPGSAELLRLLDATPVPCGRSTITAKRSQLFGYAGYGYEPSHNRFYWGGKLMLICTA